MRLASHTLRRSILAIAAITLFTAADARAANTYLELLAERMDAKVKAEGNPRIPDDLERRALTCMVTAFVKANIPPADLDKLDAIAAAGTIETDPLAARYRALTDDENAQVLMAQEAQRLCPDDLKEFFDASK